MKYALGNMLNGAGGLNADGLSLDLQFAADKTLTARKGPTPVFTRGSSATQVGASGLIEYAPENLLLQSEAFGITWAVNNALTVTSNSVTAPDGTLTADSLNFDSNAGSRIIQFAGSAVVSTFSLWLRAAAPTTCILATTAAGSAGDSITVNVTTEWQRFSVVASTWVTGTASFSCRVVNNATGTTGTIFAWGAQLERFSSARAYIPTTTAAIYGARFDHDPVTLACKGLLIEESRTNTLIQSNDFANVAWAKSNIGIGSTTNLSPDGSNNATLLIAGTASVSWIFRSGITASGSTVTFFAKSSGKGWAVVDASSGSGTAGVWFDLQNGVVGTVQSGYTASIQQFPNGFYRCRVTYPSSGAGTFCVIGVSDNNGLFISTGNGSNGIILYGAQLEAGSFPTSYIPTTTGPLTRSADVCSITGSAFSGFYNNSAGTMVAAASANGFTSTNNAIYGVESGTTIVTRVFHRAAQASRLSSQVSATLLTPAANYNSTNVVYKSALAADIDGADYVIDGTQIPDAYTGYVLTADNLKFTGMGGSTSNTTISSFRYYKKRLSVAKLQALTT